MRKTPALRLQNDLARERARRSGPPRGGPTGLIRVASLVPPIALALLLGACDNSRNAYVAPPPAKVGVARPLRQDIVRYLHVTGTTEAVSSVDLVARVQGYLRAITYKDGAAVHAGDQLFLIEQDQYKAALEQAQAVVAGANATLVNAQAQFSRQQQLGARDFASKANVNSARATLDSSQASLTQAQANVQLAQLNLNYTIIKAPFDGVVMAHKVDVGALVGYGGPTVLASIVQMDPVHVVFNVSETDVLNIRQDLARRKLSLADLGPIPVEIGTQIEPGYPHRGTLDYAAPQGDSSTGTLAARAVFPNKTYALLPGIFVRVRIPVQTLKNALLVPAAAIGSDQQGSYVLVVNDKNVVVEKHVKITAGEGGMQIIDSGLDPDDRVVVDGLLRATPGSEVAPQEVKISAPAPDTPPAAAPSSPPAAKN